MVASINNYKEMPIPKFAVTPNGYTIEKAGTFVRVSNILAVANFGNDILDAWKFKKRRDAFHNYVLDILSAPSFDSHSSDEIMELYDSAYSAPENYTIQSAQFGTELHDFLETYLTTGEIKTLKPHPYADVNICRDSMLKFVKDWNLGPHTTIKAECLIWSTIYRYAGCIDYVAHKDGKMYIMDWKTTGSLHTKYLLQLAAYWVALEERAKEYGIPEKVEHVYLVRFDKSTPFYEVVDFGREQMQYYFEIFKSLLNIYNFKEQVHL